MSQTDFPFSRSTIRYVAILLLTAFMGIASFIGVFELQNEREAGGRLFYAEQTQEMHRRFELLLESELQSYSLFASSLAIHPDLIQSLETQNPALAERFVYQTLEESKLHRPVENLWIHLIDSSLHSFYRSWSFKRGDDLSIVRPELSLLLENPTPLAQMSLGIFTLSLKHTHPIQKEGKLLGFLEVIAPPSRDNTPFLSEALHSECTFSECLPSRQGNPTTLLPHWRSIRPPLRHRF